LDAPAITFINSFGYQITVVRKDKVTNSGVVILVKLLTFCLYVLHMEATIFMAFGGEREETQSNKIIRWLSFIIYKLLMQKSSLEPFEFKIKSVQIP